MRAATSENSHVPGLVSAKRVTSPSRPLRGRLGSTSGIASAGTPAPIRRLGEALLQRLELLVELVRQAVELREMGAELRQLRLPLLCVHSQQL
jgi:hypothetical protein